MKWLCNVLSWCFTYMAVALLSLLVGSFLLNIKAGALSPHSPTSTHFGPPKTPSCVCGTCRGASQNHPTGSCPTITGAPG